MLFTVSSICSSYIGIDLKGIILNLLVHVSFSSEILMRRRDSPDEMVQFSETELLTKDGCGSR